MTTNSIGSEKDLVIKYCNSEGQVEYLKRQDYISVKCAFRDQFQSISDVQFWEDMPFGIYSVVSEMVQAMIGIEELDSTDLHALFCCAVASATFDLEYRTTALSETHLTEEDKTFLCGLLDDNEGTYYDGFDVAYEWEQASFEKEEGICRARRILRLLTDLVQYSYPQDEETMLQRVSEELEKGFLWEIEPLSLLLHCVQPYVFPFIDSYLVNKANADGCSFLLLNTLLDLGFTNPDSAETYISNVQKFKKYRNEKCKWRHYGVAHIFWLAIWDITTQIILPDIGIQEE